MIGRLLCLIGIHKWDARETTQGLRWYCTRCGKMER